MEETDVELMNTHLKELFLSNEQNLSTLDILLWANTLDDVFKYGNLKALTSFYKRVCKKFEVSSLLTKSHGMTSKKGSNVKKDGHAVEHILATEYNLVVTKNNHLKHDLKKNGKPYASSKSGRRTQWGLHVEESIPYSILENFNSWVDSHILKNIGSSNLEHSARQAAQKLQDFETKRFFFNWWLTKDENFPFLIIWEEKMNFPVQVSMSDFIENLVNNTEVSISFSKKNGYGNKITINSIVPSGKSKKPGKITIMEFEYRKDKSSFLLVSTLEKIVRFIYYYNIKQVELGTDEIN
jgi:hypothetical protein